MRDKLRKKIGHIAWTVLLVLFVIVIIALILFDGGYFIDRILVPVFFAWVIVVFSWAFYLDRIMLGSGERRIESGRHAPFRFRWPLWVRFSNIVNIKRRYQFGPRAIYDFYDDDQYDRNKLYGISFRLFPKVLLSKDVDLEIVPWFSFLGMTVIKPGNWDCAMVAWRFDPVISKIRLYSYVRRNGLRKYSGLEDGFLTSVGVGELFTSGIIVDKVDGTAEFCVASGEEQQQVSRVAVVNVGEFQWLFWYLDAWFGGNRKAPREIKYYEEVVR